MVDVHDCHLALRRNCRACGEKIAELRIEKPESKPELKVEFPSPGEQVHRTASASGQVRIDGVTISDVEDLSRHDSRCLRSAFARR